MKKISYLQQILLFALCAAVLSACETKKILPDSVEDTPPNHYLRAMLLVEENSPDKAEERFSRALALDEEYAPARAGLALVRAYAMQNYPAKEHHAIELETMRDLLDQAWSDATDPSHAFSVAVTGIRAEAQAQGEDWIDRAEDWYSRGQSSMKDLDRIRLPYYKGKEALEYFMGRAWFVAGNITGDYTQAKILLARVTGSVTGKWHEKANSLYQKIHLREQAGIHYTTTGVAGLIAGKKEVSRGDVAALLASELNLNRLFGNPLADSMPQTPSFIPADVMNHRLKEEILTILRWNIRGLEAAYDTTTQAPLFQPDRVVTRREMALLLEDILIKAARDDTLATRFFGQEHSPYNDVPPTAAYYNAVVNVSSRGLMETELSGNFRPDEPLAGAELLLAVVRLRNALALY